MFFFILGLDFFVSFGVFIFDKYNCFLGGGFFWGCLCIMMLFFERIFVEKKNIIVN